MGGGGKMSFYFNALNFNILNVSPGHSILKHTKHKESGNEQNIMKNNKAQYQNNQTSTKAAANYSKTSIKQV